jgi:hypothetical protein
MGYLYLMDPLGSPYKWPQQYPLVSPGSWLVDPCMMPLSIASEIQFSLGLHQEIVTYMYWNKQDWVWQQRSCYIYISIIIRDKIFTWCMLRATYGSRTRLFGLKLWFITFSWTFLCLKILVWNFSPPPSSKCVIYYTRYVLCASLSNCMAV